MPNIGQKSMTDLSAISPKIGSPELGRPTGPALRLDKDGTGYRLSASGHWTVHQVAKILPDLNQIIANVPVKDTEAAFIDLSKIDRLDTAGAWLLEQATDLFRTKGITPSYAGGREEFMILLEEIQTRTGAEQPGDPKIGAIATFLADIGRATRGIIRDTTTFTGFLGALTTTIIGLLARPWRFRAVPFIHHIDHTGLRAVPIVCLICFFIGAVIMQQGTIHLEAYGASPLSVNLLGVLSLREIGVLLTAIMVAGRSGSAFTAAIGSMKMREEIDAMRTLGLDPMEVLVVPRILALMVALPILTFIGDLSCLVGGAVAAKVYLGLDWTTYWDRMQDIASMKHFMAGMLKTPFAAVIIGIVGCVEGLKVGGSAESLGSHVTSSVVKSIFIVIILDAIFAMFLSEIGL